MEKVPEKIYCDECQKDIPIELLDDGTIVVKCPKCLGECLSCECHLVNECFSDEPKVEVWHIEDDEAPEQ